MKLSDLRSTAAAEQIEKAVAEKSAYVCSVCGNPIADIHPDDQGQFTIDGKPACEDCYYAKLGDLIEQNPILSPPLSRFA